MFLLNFYNSRIMWRQFLAVKSLCENEQCFIWHRNGLKYKMQVIWYFLCKHSNRTNTFYHVNKYLLEGFLTSALGFPATSFIKSGFGGEILLGISFATLGFTSFTAVLLVSSAFFCCFLCSSFLVVLVLVLDFGVLVFNVARMVKSKK